MAESSPLFGFDPNTTTVVGNYSKVAEAQGDIADAAAQSKSQQAPFDFLGLGQQVASVAGEFAQEKNMVDAHQAKLRATEFMQENDYLSGHELEQKVKEQIQTISDGNNYSSGYRKGALAVFDVGYAQALERKEEERISSTMNLLSSNFSTEIADNRANGVAMGEGFAQDWAASMSTKFKMPIEYVRNAMVSSYYQDAQMRVVTAKTPAQLAAAQAYINEAGSVLKTPLFLDSRSKKFQPVINSLRSNLNSSIGAKQKEFTQAAELELVTSFEGDQTDVWSSFPKDPRTPEGIALINQAYSNPATRARKLRTLTAGYEEAQAARDYITTYNPYDIKAPVPSKTDNKFIMPAVEGMVYNEVLQNLNNPSRLVQIASSNPDVISSAGDKLFYGFMNTNDPAQLAQFNEYFTNAVAMPGGANAMQKMFGDDYKDVVGINILSSMFTGGDVGKARDVLAEAKGSLVSPPLDPSIAEDHYSNVADLGTLGDEYMYSINTLLKVNPGLVNKKMLERVYEQFAGGMEEREGVKFNVSRFDSASQALEPDIFNEQITAMVTKFNGGVAPGEVNNLPGNIMVYKDEFGFTSGVFNASPTLDITNKLATAITTSDEKQVDTLTRTGDTFDSILSWTAEALTTNLFDTEGQLAADQKMYNQLSEIWSGSDVDRVKISEDIVSIKEMFPINITSKQVPDANQRAAMIERNVQMQLLIEQVATSFLGGNTLDEQQEQEAIEELLNGVMP